jgi:beta-N-acetylhexosaminidase
MNHPKPHIVRVVSAAVILIGASSTAVASQTRWSQATKLSECAATFDPTTMPVREQLRRVLFLGFTNETPTRLKQLSAAGIGGFFVAGQRSTAADLAALTAQLDAIEEGRSSRRVGGPFIAIDEEGGRVQRLKALGALPDARTMGTMKPADVTALVSEHAKKMRALSKAGGINMDFAPVLDLDGRSSGVIATRSFSTDPEKAVTAASAFAAGLESNGITPVYKHFPGHGRASGDSHQLLPSTPPLSELEKSDLIPFKRVIDATPRQRVFMMGHLGVKGLSTNDSTPTTWSPKAYAYLRTTLGFKGLIITDDLGMGALKAVPTVAGRASLALIAGADLVLYSTTAGAEKVLDDLEAEATRSSALRSAIARAATNIRSYSCS